jgi:hypothetical protein
MSCSKLLSGLHCCLPRMWPEFDSRARPDLRLMWNGWLFSVTLRRGHVLKHLNNDYRYINKFAVAKAKVFPHLEACVRVGYLLMVKY